MQQFTNEVVEVDTLNTSRNDLINNGLTKRVFCF